MNYKSLRRMRMTACALTAAIAFSGIGITADASGAIFSGGVDLALANGNKLENIATETTIPIEAIIEWVNVKDSDLQGEAQEPTEEDLFRNLVIAQVNNCVNVRDLPSETEGKVIGKLYNNSVGTFIGEENGWYQIKSGSVTGYVKSDYCVTGEEAVEIAKQVGVRIATVTTQTLFVRTEPSTESSVLGMVPEADELLVLEETEGWVKVDIEEGTGWVSTDYVTLHSEFVEAESKEEEAARLAKEAEERRKAREAAAAAAPKPSNQTTAQAPVS